jgi:hypothetical protein
VITKLVLKKISALVVATPCINIGIKKVSCPTSKTGKSAVYADSRFSVYYSNSSADSLN